MKKDLRPIRVPSHIAALTAVAFLAGCGGTPDSVTHGGDSPAEGAADEAALGEVQQPIINGTLEGEAGARREGVLRVKTIALRLSMPTECTGTLIRNDMVLTARHCVTDDGKPDGPLARLTNIQLSLAGEATGIAGVLSITRLQSTDTVLIRTRNLFAMNGSRFGYRRNIGLSTNAYLKGSFVNCYGYGATNTSTAGQLHSARLKVTGSSNINIVVSKTNNQSITFGDSGGPCYLDDRTLVGIATGGTSSAANAVGPQILRIAKSWADYPLTAIATAGTTRYQNYFPLDSRFPAGYSPDSVITVTPNWNPYNGSGVYNDAHTGVWHTGSAWSIFNENGAEMPMSAGFNVAFDSDFNLGGNGRVHVAGPENISWHVTTLDIPLLNGNPRAIFFVTQNWQPARVYNNHAVGVWFDGSRWNVFNEDIAEMPAGAAFNVLVPPPEAITFVHRATSSSVAGHMTYIDNPDLNEQPNATFFVTHNWSEGGSIHHPHAVGVWYDAGRKKWAIFNQDFAAMPLTAFNILIRP